MVLNHLDVLVYDVHRTAAFFTRCFGFTLTTNPQSPAIAILRGDGPFTLVIQKKKSPEQAYPDGAHFGFIVANETAVREQYARMRTEAVEGLGEVHVNGRGTMFYVRAPGALVIEVSCRPG